MRETGKTGYQSLLRKKLKKEFPQCEVHRLDPNGVQGIQDLVLLCPTTWATLEIKGSSKSHKQPNQEYYVDKHNNMSFSKIINPENEKEVFTELNKHLKNFNKKKENNNDI